MARRGAGKSGPARGPVVQPALFDKPGAEPVPAPKKRSPPHSEATYARYSGQAKCVDCSQSVYEDLVAHRPSTLLIRQARVRRVAAGTVALLCNAHAHQRRENEAAPTGRK